MSDQPARPVFHLIPHSHWEGAVFKTREQYVELGLPIILRALALLEADPDYRFTLDQVCLVKPFLERHPEAAAAFLRFVREGRLALVGATLVMADVNMPSGESFVRQVLLGKPYYRQVLGVPVQTSWQLDTFGHHAQMPQLLRLCGYRSFWFFRGVPNWQMPAEFLWEGLDGTRIPAFWLPHGYALTYGSPTRLPEFAAFMRERYALLDAFAQPGHRVGPGGADVCLPEEHLAARVREFNARPEAPFELRLSTPQEYEEALPAETGPVWRGELNPVFQGTYSSRIEVKQWTRQLEGLLTTVEKLGALLRAVGGPAVRDDGVWRAWEPVLFNHAHDLMSGVMTDQVWEDTVRGFDMARRLATLELEARLALYGAEVDTAGEGIAILVVNSLSWVRTDVARARLGFTQPGVTGVDLLDPAGNEVPGQVMWAERRADGTWVEAEVAFLARDVPALGHAVYRALPRAGAPAPAAPEPVAAAVVLENECCRLAVDACTGVLSSLVLKDGEWQALGGPGNLVVQETDRGDLWEPYRPLDGGSRIAMATVHPLPERGKAVYSDDQPGTPAAAVRGPVVQEVTVAHPLGERSAFQTSVRLYAGLPRVEIRTEIVHHDEFVRYRVAFPSAVQGGQVCHEIPFGASQRPEGVEFPAQNWADYGNADHGVALLNRGLPGNATVAGALLLSLCRSSRIVAYGFGGGYEPGMSSDSGLERGKRLVFDYAVLPHRGTWAKAAVERAGQEFNQPLLARPVALHGGPLPPRWGLLAIDSGQVVVSALKCGEAGSLILRLYEAHGKPATLQLALPRRVCQVDAVNLLEDPVAPLPIAAGRLHLSLRAFEILTLRLTFSPAPSP